ncbi:hypothetical protein ACI3EY_13710 [Ornithinimicrobium sp. LYQ92]|uniref:hypothetical protein n=1 Tax=Serinicoccus sp. LYQ92 TaxID=3378798 RepID=UPI003854868C
MDAQTGAGAEGENEGDTAEARALREAVTAVYAVLPAEFVAARTTWVKRLRGEGMRGVAAEVAALRRPTAAAGVVNAVVRAQDPVVERLREVGARLRQAQSAMDSATLGTLRGDRDELLTAWVDAGRGVSARPMTAAVEAEVRDTAVAALADASATEVVLSGSLTRALGYSGFGEVDVADAVARTSTGVVLTRIEGGAGDGGASGDAGRAAADAGGDAGGDDEEAGRDRAAQRAAAKAAERAAQKTLRRAETAHRDAERAVAEADVELDRARSAAQAAARDLEQSVTARAEAEDQLRAAREVLEAT